MVDTEVSRIAHAAGALVIVDNVFATPVFSNAVAQGADVVVYSTTKHVDGQGRALGGVICGTKEFVRKVAEPYLKHTGAAMSPFTAWIMLNGMATLDLRVGRWPILPPPSRRHWRPMTASLKSSSRACPAIRSNSLGDAAMGTGGTLVTFEILGGKDAAFKFCNALEIIKISNNLGDAKSIATHPATTTHQRLPQPQKDALGITPGLIRLSVGLEDVGDLISDLKSALSVI